MMIFQIQNNKERLNNCQPSNQMKWHDTCTTSEIELGLGIEVSRI